jgi:branched-chain amino acid transport system permease protein
VKFGNLFIAGLTTGSIYAVFAVCVTFWFRVSNILNLAVGDFAMIGALGTDYLFRVEGWAVVPAIAATLAGAGVMAYLYDRVVLHFAQDGKRHQEGVVITFFFTFALSFFIEGVGEVLFGTDVHAAPELWKGGALSLAGVHIQRAGVLVLICALVSGLVFTVYTRYTLTGKAIEACGENYLGARIVGVDNRKFRRSILIVTALLACVFGILESPLTGFTFSSGGALGLNGFVAASYAGFHKPARGVVVGLIMGLLEALLGGYVSAQYADPLLYGILAITVLTRPQMLNLVAPPGV